MKKFADRLRSERGFTLIEMIAAMTLFSMIVGIISMVMMFGFRSYHKITIENSLRDEADLIMSSVISELYTFAPQKVVNTASGIQLIKEDSDGTVSTRTLAFVEENTDGQLFTRMEIDNALNDPRTTIESDLSGSTVTSTSSNDRACTVQTSCESGLININLILTQHYDGRPYEMELESKFGF